MDVVHISVVACVLLAYTARSQTTELISLVPKPVIIKVGHTALPVLNRPVHVPASIPLYAIALVKPVCAFIPTEQPRGTWSL